MLRPPTGKTFYGWGASETSTQKITQQTFTVQEVKQKYNGTLTLYAIWR